MINYKNEIQTLNDFQRRRNYYQTLIYKLVNDKNVEFIIQNFIDFIETNEKLDVLSKYHFNLDLKDFYSIVFTLFQTIQKDKEFNKYNSLDFDKDCNVFSDSYGKKFLTLIGYLPLTMLFLSKLKYLELESSYHSKIEFTKKEYKYLYSNKDDIPTKKDILKIKQELDSIDLNDIETNIQILLEQMKKIDIIELGKIYYEQYKLDSTIKFENLKNNFDKIFNVLSKKK